MVFDEKTRNTFLDNEDDWPQLARRLLQEKKAIGSSMSNSASLLHDQGLTSPDTFKYIVNRTNSMWHWRNTFKQPRFMLDARAIFFVLLFVMRISLITFSLLVIVRHPITH